MIVDQLMADRYFPRAGCDRETHPDVTRAKRARSEYRTIVGVVPHLKVYGFEETTVLPQAYLPMTQQPQTGLVVLLRTSLSPKSLEKPVREIVASLDPAQPAFEFKTMQERVEETWATPRLMSFLLVCFAMLALTLAVVGLYGVMAFNGLRRMREIGVRLALGAMPAQIRDDDAGPGNAAAGVGLVLGLRGSRRAFACHSQPAFRRERERSADLRRRHARPGGAALFACWIPARRASRVNPMQTLRNE